MPVLGTLGVIGSEINASKDLKKMLNVDSVDCSQLIVYDYCWDTALVSPISCTLYDLRFHILHSSLHIFYFYHSMLCSP